MDSFDIRPAAPNPVLDLREDLTPPAVSDYIDRIVPIPPGVDRVRVELDYLKVTDRFQLYAALFDPAGVLRGHVQCPGGPGPRALRFAIATHEASPGCIPGPIPGGEWTIRIDLDRFREAGEYSLRVFADVDIENAPAPADRDGAARDLVAAPPAEPETEPEPRGARWLRGELHAHSIHSDGRNSIAEMVARAAASGLDFLALSDHVTWSHWRELSPADPIVTIPSIEVTSHRGHANAHGLTTWPDVYIDRPERAAGDLIDEVHRQGGIFGVNHPFSGQQAWRRSDVDWAHVDVLEVVNQGQDANNDAAIGLWDRLLAQGYDIAPVAGTDCHDLDDPAQQLGQVVTALKDAERTRAGVLGALRRAATMVTRGSHVDLSVSDGVRRAGLGEHLPTADRLWVEVEVTASNPGTLFVFRDGLMWHQDEIAEGTHRVRIEDADPVLGCYRAELHRRSTDPRHWASAWRSHESFEALTSFVRIVAQRPPARPGAATPG